MLYIRTDINDVIATGHVMRCLSIADAAQKWGENTTFILADEQGKQYIEDRGYRTIVLYTKWNDMESELPVLLEKIQKEKICSILVDSYQVTNNYMITLSEYVKTLYIDDLNEIEGFVHTLICYMSYWEKLHLDEKYLHSTLLLGLQYAPMRAVFQNINEKLIRDNIENILLLSGGTDSFHVLEQILDVIKDKGFREITIICGRYYKDEAALREKYKDYASIQIYKSVDNIEKYMMWADLAISAGGTTLYELCACGTPTISYAIADNQLENVRSFSEKEIIDYAGDIRCDNVISNIDKLITENCDVKLRRERSKKMQKLVDGNGASRIVKEWKKLLEE